MKKIIKYFTGIYGSPALKNDHVNVICSKYKLKPGELLFFGDSIIDLEAATGHGIKFILRLHEKNKTYFQAYSGQKINSFKKIRRT